MPHTSFVPGAALFILFLSSCGTSKKLESAQSQINQLQEKNSQLEQNISDLKKQASDYQAQNAALTDEFSKYKATCEQTEQKLQVVQAVLTEEAGNLQKVQEKLDEGLADFKERGVEVYIKNGLLYVSMADNLLYKSGSSSLGESGKEALSGLASVLNDYPHLKVVVVGNTDDVKFKKGGDNWSLSTERANGVVRLLSDEFGVDPTRLTAAGKGKYNPVADNGTAEGKAKNRRTDIVLNPDIDRVWNSVKNEQ